MKIQLAAALTAAFALGSATVVAGEHGTSSHESAAGHGTAHAAPAHGSDHGSGHGGGHASPFYVVLKGLMTTGDTVSHGPGVTIEGHHGAGFGLDFGYMLTHNLGVELVTSYAGGRVTETVAGGAVAHRSLRATTTHEVTTTAVDTHGTTTTAVTDGHGTTTTGAAHSVVADANYFTYGISLAYTMHLSEKAGLLFKVGYEGERETIDKLGISATAEGMTYAVGAEIKLGNHYEFVVEYEGSRIKGPRGSSLFVGIKRGF